MPPDEQSSIQGGPVRGRDLGAARVAPRPWPNLERRLGGVRRGLHRLALVVNFSLRQGAPAPSSVGYDGVEYTFF